MIAQLGERQTEDLEVPGSIPGHGNYCGPLLRCMLGHYDHKQTPDIARECSHGVTVTIGRMVVGFRAYPRPRLIVRSKGSVIEKIISIYFFK